MENYSPSKRPTLNLEYSQTLVHDKLSNYRYSAQSNCSESSSKILPIFQQLQNKFQDFDDFAFPPLELPNSKARNLVKKKNKKAEKEENIETTQTFYKTFRGKDSQKSHNLSATATFNTTRSSIGPGKYNPTPKNTTKVVYFSATPRFVGQTVKFAENFLENKSKKCIGSPTINKNKDMTPHNKVQKQKNLEVTSKIREFESLVHKNTKIAIETMTRDVKLKNYTEKISRFEWRMRRFEIHKVKLCWGCLISLASTAFIFNLKVRLKKHTIKRINKMFMVLYLVSRALGKILRKLQNIRWRHLVKILNQRTPYIRKWLDKRKNLFNKIIVSIIERVLFGNYMTRLMVNFKKYIYLIQNSIRHMIKIKRARNWGLMLLFKKLETKILIKKGVKRNIKDHNFAPAMIETEIRKYYIKTARKHMVAMRNYREKLKGHAVLKENDTDFKHWNFDRNINKRPLFLLYTNTDEIVADIKMALGIEVRRQSSPVRRATTKLPYGRRTSLLK